MSTLVALAVCTAAAASVELASAECAPPWLERQALEQILAQEHGGGDLELRLVCGPEGARALELEVEGERRPPVPLGAILELPEGLRLRATALAVAEGVGAPPPPGPRPERGPLRVVGGPSVLIPLDHGQPLLGGWLGLSLRLTEQLEATAAAGASVGEVGTTLGSVRHAEVSGRVQLALRVLPETGSSLRGELLAGWAFASPSAAAAEVQTRSLDRGFFGGGLGVGVSVPLSDGWALDVEALAGAMAGGVPAGAAGQRVAGVNGPYARLAVGLGFALDP